MELDPVKYEIFYNRLQRSLTEAKETVRKVACSVITREAGEVAVGLFLPTGDTVAMAAGLILHVNSISRAIKYMMANKYAEDIGIYDGDHFLNNDAHVGGSHMPDMLVIAPYFYKGEHVGWIGSFSHVAEVGAIEPGGACPSATEFYHEGICLPCVKIVERGKQRRDLFNMMCRAVRDPRPIAIDTKAKIAGNERARQRINQLIEEFGLDFFKAAAAQLVDDAEKQARSRVKELRPGIYKSRLYTDYKGKGREGITVIELELEVTKNGDLILKAPVISPSRKGYNNAAAPCTEGAIFNSMMTQLFYDKRWNGGTLRVLKIDVPYGTILNTENTSAIYMGIVGVGMQAMCGFNAALSEAFFVSGKYGDIMAPDAQAGSPFFGGIDQFGRVCANMVADSLAGGMGARYGKDGVDTGLFKPNPWTDCADVEAGELLGPLVYLGRRNAPDSGGFGQYRGGSAMEAIYLVCNTPNLGIGTKGSGRHVVTTPGLFGGYPAACVRAEVVQNTDFLSRVAKKEDVPHNLDNFDKSVFGQKEVLNPSSPFREVKEGDLLGVRFYGGAGVGDPIERDPIAVARDIENKITSFRAAREVYCLAIDEETLKVDLLRTEKLRQAKRKERLKLGQPAKSYIKRMVEMRRKRELPAPALEYFDEMSSFSEEFRRQLKFEEKFATDGGQ